MQRLMIRLEGFLRHRGRMFVGLWLLVFVACVPFAVKQADALTAGGFTVPGSQSLAVQEELKRDFPQVEGSVLAAVLVPEPGTRADSLEAARRRLADAVAQQPGVGLGGATSRPSQRGGRVLVPLRLDVATDDASVDVTGELRERLAIGEPVDGVRTYLAGYGALWSGMNELSKEDLAQADLIGFPLVAVILLVVFGSLAAAALPLGLGIAAVTVTGAAIYGLSQLMEMSVFVTNMASMVGIGVAVDYSLFIVARYREELRAGRTRDEARARAMATSGLAVLFSGATVIASLAGLFLLDNTALRSMAIGAILVVAIAMLASATLLPVLMRIIGGRLDLKSTGAPPERSGFWHRWTERIMRRPLLSVLCSGGLLLALAAPLADMHLSIGALSQLPRDFETRVGAQAAAQVAAPGSFSPIRIVVTPNDAVIGNAVHSPAVRDATARLQADPAFARVESPRLSEDGRSALVTALTRTGGESPQTRAVIDSLRRELPEALRGEARVEVGGSPAALTDLVDLVRNETWKVLVFVVAVSYLVLLVLLRSVLLPLKAVILNLLSVGAALGVLVATFQWGWLDGLLGFESPGSIDWLTPPLVLAVVFGLSMDYEVFLLSRIRERYEATGNTSAAVAGGLSSSARTITSAALIMVCVFAVFVGTGVTSIQQIGVGLAVAITIDATLVRLILMPAAMQLFGRWNWWLPRPLQHILPKGSFDQVATVLEHRPSAVLVEGPRSDPVS